MFHYIDGGADDEMSLRGATTAFDNYELMPRVLVDVDKIDMRTKILGQELAWPVFCSPTGMSRLFHHDKELAVVKAAEKFGTMYSLSTLGTTSIEDIAKTSGTPKMFQIYVHKDRGLTAEFVHRCKAAGFSAMCLTVDAPMAGNRERDFRTGMIMPPRFGLKGILNFLYHFEWTLNIVRNPDFRLANVVHRIDALAKGTMPLIEYMNSQLSRSVTWDDAAWLVKEWGGPFAIKGLQAPEDARMARDIGASAIMISNHGGRQLDGAQSSIEALPAIVDAVGQSIEVHMDGGIRSGQDVVKARALGAKGVYIGRSMLYGLGAMGEAGVTKALEIIHKELDLTMAFCGRTQMDTVDKSILLPGTFPTGR